MSHQLPIERPFLFLDIDDTVLERGLVFDALELEKRGRLPEGFDHLTPLDFTYRTARGERQARVYIDEERLADLREIAQLYDIVWTSGWKGAARQLDAALGIKSHYCLAPSQGDLGIYKGRAIMGFLGGNHTWHIEDGTAARDELADLPVTARHRSFAWADDDTDQDEGRVRALAEQLGLEMLCIHPDKGTALTAEHFDQLREFAAKVGRGRDNSLKET